jgi:Bacterial Ig domain
LADGDHVTSTPARTVIAALATVLLSLGLASSAGAVTNSPPVANPDSAQAWANHSSATTSSVLMNDSDADGDELRAYVWTNPTHGHFDPFFQWGGFWYVPDPGFVGTDSFTYRATDLKSWSEPATVTIEVWPDTAPVTSPDSYSVGSGKTLHATSVLANDYDSQYDPTTAVKVTDPSHGTLAMQPDGTFTYVSQTGYTGPDSFTYYATDGTNASEPETVSITVVDGENHPPTTATSFDISVWENDYGVCWDLTYEASDVDGDQLSTVIESSPQHGTLSQSDPNYTCYAGFFNYSGPDEYTYRVSDGTTTSELVTVHITVEPIFAPTVTSEEITVKAGRTVTGNVLANDSDPNADPLTAVLSYSSQGAGALAIALDGSFTYTAPPGWSGLDQYRYTVSDDHGNSTFGFINFSVWTDPASAPSAADLAAGKVKDQAPTQPFANIRVQRAVVRNGRLSVRADISKLATGKVKATFRASGHTSRVRAKIVAGAIRFTLRLSARQRRSASGVLTLAYAGNAKTRSEKVTVTAARRSSALDVKAAYVDASRNLRVAGTIARRARGVVRVRLTYSPRPGKTKSYEYTATIHAGRWALSDVLPAEAARAHGQVVVSYKGDKRRGISGAHVSQGL